MRISAPLSTQIYTGTRYIGARCTGTGGVGRRSRLDSNLCVDDDFFSSSFEFGHVVLDLFSPFSNSLSAQEVRLTATDIDRRSPRPGTMSLFLSQSRSALKTH